MKFILPLLLCYSCFLNADDKTYSYSFEEGTQRWVADFCDYPVGQEAFFELTAGWGNLPVEIKDGNLILTKGLFLSGNNHSDDLFMFVKRQLGGLRPHTHYVLSFIVLLETDVPEDFLGIGGSPGKSVYFKAGASSIEPQKVRIDDYYGLNVDKGNQAQEGQDAIVLGDLEGVGSKNGEYQPKQLESRDSFVAQTDADGRLWVFAGTDSGFEGKTQYYIAKIEILAQACD